MNFFPAPEVAMAGLGAAILMSYLVTRSLWVNRARKEERALLYPVWFLLLVFMHYLSFATVLPAWGREADFSGAGCPQGRLCAHRGLQDQG